ncbi:hypothetical protein AB5I41_06435 [Sphingomonas sp. MMS24-JH45]
MPATTSSAATAAPPAIRLPSLRVQQHAVHLGTRSVAAALRFRRTPAPRLSIRGGCGIFGGGTPDVYIGNSFSHLGRALQHGQRL